MDIYQLRYFLAVADLGNFTKAAKSCSISQPSLSQQIINLEEELGQRLFHRLGRVASLTDHGRILAEQARQILADVDGVIREIRQDSAVPRVSVGAIPTVASFFLPAVLAYCRETDLKLEMVVREDVLSAITEAVANGDLDWGVVTLPVADPRMHSEVLFTEPLLLAVGSMHPLAQQPVVRATDLRDQTFVMLGDGSSLTAQIRQFCGDNDIEPRIGFRCAQVATVKTFTALGMGVTILPQSARSANDPAGLVFKKFEDRGPYRAVGLVHHRRRHLSRGARLFAEAARAVVGPPDRAVPIAVRRD